MYKENGKLTNKLGFFHFWMAGRGEGHILRTINSSIY